MKWILIGMMGAGLGATAPYVGPSKPLDIWFQWGLAGIVVGFTIWRDMKREARLSSALEENEKFIREKLTGLIADHNKAVKHCQERGNG